MAEEKKNAAAVALGRRSGLKGGKARAEKLTARQRAERSRKAAVARWSKKKTREVFDCALLLTNTGSMKYSKGDILVPKGKLFPESAIIVDGYDARGRLLLHPMGGGMQARLDAASVSVFRLVDEVERAWRLYRRGRFVLADPDE